MEIKGKFGSAIVYTENVDEETISQIISILNSPVAKDACIRIMPDCHAGAGCVIGTTMKIIDKIIPNVVGVDIGCGMRIRNIGKVEIDYKELDEFIKENIPSGFACRENVIKGYDIPDLSKLKYLKDVDRLYKSIGTLGGGNHFIEIDEDEDKNKYVVIHSGSRNLGLQVAKYYQEQAIKNLNNVFCDPKEEIEKLKEENRQNEIEAYLKSFYEERKKILGSMNKDLAYITDVMFDNYLRDMKICQEYASTSRRIMEELISCYILKINKINLNKEYSAFETIHNYIDLDNMILRKGAVRALKDEVLLIPLNMKYGSLICKGKGNVDWNNSAPHGAGRILSRSNAKKEIKLKDYIDSMEGIYSSSISMDTIDESCFAYKDADEIINNIKETVDIIKIIKPKYNFKAKE